MTVRVGTKGQVVIPRRLRELRGLTPGTQVTFEDRSDGVLVKPERATSSLRGRYRGSGMARKLTDDRSAERR